MKPADLKHFQFERALRDANAIDIPWEVNNEFARCNVSRDDRRAILGRCLDFLVELAKQVSK
jgi:hypothetical protein